MRGRCRYAGHAKERYSQYSRPKCQVSGSDPLWDSLWGFLRMLLAVAVFTQGEARAASAVENSSTQPTLDLGAKLYARYRIVDEPRRHLFDIDRARFSLDFEIDDFIAAQLDVDVAQAPGLKDAFVDIWLAQGARLRAGQFKKPFGRLKLLSPRKLPLARRGVVNDRIVEELAFGGRDLGMMLHGKVVGVKYALGVFNGNGTALEQNPGKDAALTLRYDFTEALQLGLSGAFKYHNTPGVVRAKKAVFAGGVDMRFKTAALRWTAEALWSQEGITSPQREQFGIVGLMEGVLELNPDYAIHPLVKIEYLDNNIYAGDNHAWAVTAGVNLHARDRVRVMFQGEKIWATSRSAVEPEWIAIAMVALDFSLTIYGEK